MEKQIKSLKDAINGEREKILMLKSRYTNKLDEKNEMEKILRQCIADYKDELWEIKTELKRVEGSAEGVDFEARIKQNIKEILDKEKRLTLLYDKLFHSKPLQKDVEMLATDRI